MAVTAFLYAKAMLALANKEIDWTTDTIKCCLTTSSYAPDQAAHNYYDDITNECPATGNYATGGATLGTCTATSAALVATFGAADTSWATSTITARYAVIYDSTPGSAATNPLIGWVNFGADVTSTGGTFLITWAATGIFTLTVS